MVMIIDCHCHILTKQVIQRVTSRSAVVEELKFLSAVDHRSDPKFLDEDARKNNIECCILFPTASPDKVQSENDRHIAIASTFPRLKALGTLHPQMNNLADEVERVSDLCITGFKLASFAQRFDIASDDVKKKLLTLKKIGMRKKITFTIALDTFNRANVHFKVHEDHITTPAKLNSVVNRHPEIRFLATHMGGLRANFHTLRRHLKPAPNLYLDTSNAAHTLNADQFVQLLQEHGADHILFGTDWPWFDHAPEILLIDSLLDKANFDPYQKNSRIPNKR